jgi:hypothetical protein
MCKVGTSNVTSGLNCRSSTPLSVLQDQLLDEDRYGCGGTISGLQLHQHVVADGDRRFDRYGDPPAGTKPRPHRIADDR